MTFGCFYSGICDLPSMNAVLRTWSPYSIRVLIISSSIPISAQVPIQNLPNPTLDDDGSMLCRFLGHAVRLLIALCCIAQGAQAEAGATDARPTGRASLRSLVDDKISWGNTVRGPVCGVYAACSAIQALGGNVSPRSLINERYVGACDGTTQAELVAAIEDSGYAAFPVDALSSCDLFVSDLPFIALVRPTCVSRKYSHWITVQATKDGTFRVSDSGLDPYTLKPAELMSVWSGAGVFVGRTGGASPLVNVYLLRAAMLLAGVVAVCVMHAAWSRNPERSRLSGYCRIAVVGLGACGAAAVMFGDIANMHHGLDCAAAAYHKAGIPSVLEEGVDKSRNGEALLIDARHESDFAHDAIAEAVNIPVYATEKNAAKCLARIPKGTPLYVYCQSASCDFDDTVGQLLAAIGFQKVYVCSDGFFEYRKVNQDGRSH